MEETSVTNKCYYNEHSEQTAINYCFRCKKFLCETCSTDHYSVNPKHNLFSVDKDLNLNFTGFCTEANHPNKLDYYCSTHNHLICAACLCKLKERGDGQHTECNACYIEDIKETKKSELNDNIKLLRKFSLNMKKMIKDITNIIERVNPIKENIVLNIKNIFNDLRIELDEREQELLNEVENVYNKHFFSEYHLKECNKFPTKIKYNIEKAKNVLDNWDEGEKNGKLNLLINDCINIENNILDLKNIQDKINSLTKKSTLQLSIDNNDVEIISEKIKNLGKALFFNYKYYFNPCPSDINQKRIYKISGEKANIITKTGENFIWTGATCANGFSQLMEYKWKIKIIQSKTKQIMVGIAPADFDINKIDSSDFSKNICGWYFYCYDLMLYSGPPHNYVNKAIKLKNFNDEIMFVMNMDKGTLRLIISDFDYGEIYKKIPVDKPIFPVVCLFNQEDAVEIIGL